MYHSERPLDEIKFIYVSIISQAGVQIWQQNIANEARRAPRIRPNYDGDWPADHHCAGITLWAQPYGSLLYESLLGALPLAEGGGAKHSPPGITGSPHDALHLLNSSWMVLHWYNTRTYGDENVAKIVIFHDFWFFVGGCTFDFYDFSDFSEIQNSKKTSDNAFLLFPHSHSNESSQFQLLYRRIVVPSVVRS